MITFGMSRSHREGCAISCRCDACGHSVQTAVKHFRYLHLFWLPVVPLGAGYDLVCDRCERVLKGRKVSADVKRMIEDRNRHLRRPAWHFIGTLLMVGMVGYNVEADGRQFREAQVAAAEPRVGDVWVMELEPAIPGIDDVLRFGTARVSAVTEQGVEFAFSDYTFMMSSSARRHAAEALQSGRPEYFDAGTVLFEAQEVMDLQQESHLQLVRRY